MNTRRRILDAAFEILDREGTAGFSTRAVCAAVGVGAPTLYHHFGSADGLLSDTIGEVFERFLRDQTSASSSSDPETALRESWDDYVAFAAAHPRLYASMLERMLAGAHIPAVNRCFTLLTDNIRRIAEAGGLALPADAAAQLAWGTANSVALLHVTAALDVIEDIHRPRAHVVDSIREQMISEIRGTGPTLGKP